MLWCSQQGQRAEPVATVHSRYRLQSGNCKSQGADEQLEDIKGKIRKQFLLILLSSFAKVTIVGVVCDSHSPKLLCIVQKQVIGWAGDTEQPFTLLQVTIPTKNISTIYLKLTVVLL